MAADTRAESRAEEERVAHSHGVEALVRPEPGPVEHAPVGNVPLWVGVLAGPIIFLVLLETNYVLEEWACRAGVYWPMHVAPAVATLLTAGALVLSWRNWTESGREWPRDDGGSVERSRFMSALGVLMSGGFILVMIAQWIPVMVLGPCQHS